MSGQVMEGNNPSVIFCSQNYKNYLSSFPFKKTAVSFLSIDMLSLEPPSKEFI